MDYSNILEYFTSPQQSMICYEGLHTRNFDHRTINTGFLLNNKTTFSYYKIS